MSFYLVTGLPFSGSRHIARSLHSPPDVAAYHMPKVQWGNHSWWDYTRHEATYWDRKTTEDVFDPVYDFYYNRLSYETIVHDTVFDVGSFLPAMVHKICLRTKVDGIIYVVRNGVQNVKDLHNFSLNNPQLANLMTDIIRHSLQQAGLTVPRSTAGESPFEWWCRMWGAHKFILGWLKDTLDTPIYVYLLDDLAEGEKILDEFSVSIPARILNSTPDDIWSRWSDDEKAMFLRWCRFSMKCFGCQSPWA